MIKERKSLNRVNNTIKEINLIMECEVKGKLG
jgi:hypothetical protein